MSGSPRVSAIFLHSGFRSGSTWFWHRFREAAGTCAYYEPFHEHKAVMTAASIAADRSDIWSSGHPALSAPYNMEYRALLNPEGGVAYYRERFDFQAYYTAGRDPQQQRYVEHLAAHARSLGKVPVYGFCRSQGRVPWFKQTFPGVNIVTLRDPWDQWASIVRNVEQGNGYFAFRFYRIACTALHGSDHRSFFEGLPLSKPVGETAQAQSASLEHAFRNLSLELQFRIFLRVYILDLLLAVPAADAVVDLDRLSESADERAAVTHELRQLTGLGDLSFDDCALPHHSPSAGTVFLAAMIEASAALTLYETRCGLRVPPVLRDKLRGALRRLR